jgi:hypothetical protein
MHGVRLLRLYRQEVAVMVSGTEADRKREVIWRSPPWTEESAPWQAIERSLPADHLARRIRTFVLGLDLDELRRSYLGVGKRPFPPALLVMMILYEMHSGQLHPCRWAEDCKFADPVKWLMMGLQPSASSLYGFRQRLVPYVELWNQQLIQRALADGVTQADVVSDDGTFVAALGSRHRLLQAKTLAQRLGAVRQALAEDARAARARVAAPVARQQSVAAGRLAEGACPAQRVAVPAGVVAERRVPSPRPYWMAKTSRGRRRQLYRYRQAQQRLDALLAQHGQRENRRAKRKRRRVEQVRICPTEPEAALGRDKLKTFRPLYNVQVISDTNTPLILGYGVHASNTDAGLFIPTMQGLNQSLGRLPKKVLVDGIYATAANLAYCDEHDVTLYAPVVDQAAGARKGPARPGAAPAKPKQLGKEEFRWDAAAKTYYCPEGHELIQIGCQVEKRERDQEVKVYQYRCPPQHCRSCGRAAECTQAPDKGRTIKRSEHEEKVDALRQRMKTPEGEALYKKRSQSVEPRFGDLKAHRGLRCFTGFGMAMATLQVGLLVLVHNALYLLTACRVGGSGAVAASCPDASCQPRPGPAPAVHPDNAGTSRSRESRPQAPT